MEYKAQNDISIQLWDEGRFAAARSEWTALLENAEADRFFLSWEWMHSWWTIFAVPAKMQLRLYVAYDAHLRLIGIAPLYISTSKVTGGLMVRRLQFIGNCWRERDTMPTELLDFITMPDGTHRITRALLAQIYHDQEWDEFVLASLRTDSITYLALNQQHALPGCHLRKPQFQISYYLTTEGDFQDYLGRLGKNTRLKLYNRRKVLTTLGEVDYQSSSERLEEQFVLLNQLHEQRWGGAAFDKARLDFNLRVARLFAERQQVYFSTLSLSGQPISIQYNYNIDGHVYNLQAGFASGLNKKIAPGYLHFGYELEQAFHTDTKVYDFLAGEGMKTDYKRHLTGQSVETMDLQIIRSWYLKILYRVYDSIKKRF